jgi:hypothetical protein
MLDLTSRVSVLNKIFILLITFIRKTGVEEFITNTSLRVPSFANNSSQNFNLKFPYSKNICNWKRNSEGFGRCLTKLSAADYITVRSKQSHRELNCFVLPRWCDTHVECEEFSSTEKEQLFLSSRNLCRITRTTLI